MWQQYSIYLQKLFTRYYTNSIKTNLLNLQITRILFTLSKILHSGIHFWTQMFFMTTHTVGSKVMFSVASVILSQKGSLFSDALELVRMEGPPYPSGENDQVGRRLAPRKDQTGNTRQERLIRNIDAFPSQDWAGRLPLPPQTGTSVNDCYASKCQNEAGLLVISLVKDSCNTDANDIECMW